MNLPPVSGQQIGINLAGLHDWNSELPFVDVFRLSRSWVSQEEGKPWGHGPPLQLDNKGWVTTLPHGTWAETCILNIRGGHYPRGTYTLFYEGRGKIDINNVDGAFKQTENLVEFEVTGDEGIVWIQIKETDPSDYIRNIRVYPPCSTDQDDLLRPGFINDWRGVTAVRFMEFMAVNNSLEQHWGDRVKMDDATWTIHGAPLEVALQIANTLQASPWFSLPHKADDNYVRQYAQMVHARLDPELNVYIEYSNETWNSLFQQTRYCQDQGLAQKLSKNRVEAGHHYAVKRSLEIFTIWEEVFGSTDRLVRVISGQAASSDVNERRLRYKRAWQRCDALAIAPYITLNVSPTSTPPLRDVAPWSGDKLKTELFKKLLPKSVDWMRTSREITQKYGVSLIAYEGGQHLVGMQGAENDERLTRLFHEANRSKYMGKLYDNYLEEWQKISSDGLICLWLSTEIWSKWGSWGLREYYDDTVTNSPKLKTVLTRLQTASP